MTDTQRQLLQAIVTDKNEDSVRLAYADYLREHGDDNRAEFIELQVKLARWHCPWCQGKGTLLGCAGDKSNPPCDCGIKELHDREWKLLHQEDVESNETHWFLPYIHMFLGPDARPVTPGQPRNEGRILWWDWDRGFINTITCSAQDWLDHADKLVWQEGDTEDCAMCVNGKCYDGFQLPLTCDVCEGTGTVPRPMPDTALPLEKVTLTTPPYQVQVLVGTPAPTLILRPEWTHDERSLMFDTIPQVEAELRRKWGIDFIVPSVFTTLPGDDSV